MYGPETDGVDHINIYSKGKTEIGRKLSNFALFPFTCEDGKFNSIEGYWYWLSCKDDRLRQLHGFAAKKLGRELRAPDYVKDESFKQSIIKATQIKLDAIKNELINLNLPLRHYYVVYNSAGELARIIDLTDSKDLKWLMDFINNYIAYLKTPQLIDLNNHKTEIGVGVLDNRNL